VGVLFGVNSNHLYPLYQPLLTHVLLEQHTTHIKCDEPINVNYGRGITLYMHSHQRTIRTQGLADILHAILIELVVGDVEME
jgi:hypothetical protein